MSEAFFLGLQMEYDLRMLKRELGKALVPIKPRAACRGVSILPPVAGEI